jgi:hypothetical protein
MNSAGATDVLGVDSLPMYLDLLINILRCSMSTSTQVSADASDGRIPVWNKVNTHGEIEKIVLSPIRQNSIPFFRCERSGFGLWLDGHWISINGFRPFSSSN